MRRLEVKSRAARVLPLLLVGVVGLMFLLKQCSSERPQRHSAADVRSGGDTVNIAIEYSPMAMIMTGDTLGGFGYDMMRAVAAHAGMPVKFTPVTSLSQTLRAMAKGRYDVIIAEIPVTVEFRERYRFTMPVCLDRMVLVQHVDSAGNVAVNTQLDLARRHVSVIAGSPALDRIRNLSHEIGDTIYVDSDSLHSAEQLFLLAAAGEIYPAVINAATARTLAAGREDVNVSRGVSFTQFQSWVVTRNNKALADSLDSAIVRFRRTAAYGRLIDRYRLMPVK